jgi:hypothetical protein
MFDQLKGARKSETEGGELKLPPKCHQILGVGKKINSNRLKINLLEFGLVVPPVADCHY